MSRNYGFGESKVKIKVSTSWPGTPAKISGGYITSMTKHGRVIWFPGASVPEYEYIRMAGHAYHLRPGSLADRVLKWVTVAVDGE